LFDRQGKPRPVSPKYALLKHLMTGGDLDLRAASAAEIHTASVLSFLFRFAFDMWGHRWSLLVSDGTVDFVASDSPCSKLLPRLPTDEAPLPSLLAPALEVALPISRSLALIGTHDEVAAKSIADGGLVADINFRTMIAASRFVYASTPDFVFLMPGDRAYRASERWDEIRHSLGKEVSIDELIDSL
jgi:hypothetical protein